jgi:hypothetical protein
MGLADVLVPWLIFGTGVAVICVRLLRSRRGPRDHTGWRRPPPAEQWPVDPRVADQAADPVGSPSASRLSRTACTAGREDAEQRGDGVASKPKVALQQEASPTQD